MPTPLEILEHLETASREAAGLALAWHAITGGLLVALASGWRPDVAHVRLALPVPLLSASLVAWVFGNPFNGTAQFALAAVLWLLGSRSPRGKTALAGSWTLFAGLGLVGFAWVYPRFFENARLLDCLLYSPMGVIPCPTLSLLLGLSLVFEGSLRRDGTITLALGGAFYGCFGWWILDVSVDSVLVAGSLLVLVTSLPRQARRE